MLPLHPRARRDADATRPVPLESARARRDADATVPVRTTFLRGGEASVVHDHGDEPLWTHVVSGELVEDRWTARKSGGYFHERRALRSGQVMAAPGDTLHRVRARRDTVFVTSCACGCLARAAIDAETVEAVVRGARADEVPTLVGEPAPVD